MNLCNCFLKPCQLLTGTEASDRENSLPATMKSSLPWFAPNLLTNGSSGCPLLLALEEAMRAHSLITFPMVLTSFRPLLGAFHVRASTEPPVAQMPFATLASSNTPCLRGRHTRDLHGARCLLLSLFPAQQLLAINLLFLTSAEHRANGFTEAA